MEPQGWAARAWGAWAARAWEAWAVPKWAAQQDLRERVERPVLLGLPEWVELVEQAESAVVEVLAAVPHKIR